MKQYTIEREQAVYFVIDMQERLLPAMEHPERLKKNASILAQAAKAYGLPILYTVQYPKGLGETYEELQKDFEEVGAFRAEKTAYDGFVPEIRQALADSGRKQIVLAGMETHICLFQTTRSLLADGYNVFIPVDAVGSRTKENHRTALELLREMGAVITSTESVLFDLMKDAKDPHFKTLQALIK